MKSVIFLNGILKEENTVSKMYVWDAREQSVRVIKNNFEKKNTLSALIESFFSTGLLYSIVQKRHKNNAK